MHSPIDLLLAAAKKEPADFFNYEVLADLYEEAGDTDLRRYLTYYKALYGSCILKKPRFLLRNWANKSIRNEYLEIYRRRKDFDEIVPALNKQYLIEIPPEPPHTISDITGSQILYEGVKCEIDSQYEELTKEEKTIVEDNDLWGDEQSIALDFFWILLNEKYWNVEWGRQMFGGLTLWSHQWQSHPERREIRFCHRPVCSFVSKEIAERKKL